MGAEPGADDPGARSDMHTHEQDVPIAGWLLRLAEFAALFFVVPLLLTFRVIPVHIILFLLAAGVVCLVVLLFDRRFPRRRLWDSSHFLRRLAVVVAVFIVFGGVLAGLVAWLLPEHFLSLVRTRPALWQMIMILYPLLSVYPQEVIYRAFLFHRYRTIFPRPWMLVCASAVSFGFVHVYFWNWLAVVLSLAGGFLFAWTYQRTGSLLMAIIEHALYGCLIFTVGLGGFFFHGTAQMVRGLAS